MMMREPKSIISEIALAHRMFSLIEEIQKALVNRKEKMIYP
jgi:hypothetical protein